MQLVYEKRRPREYSPSWVAAVMVWSILMINSRERLHGVVEAAPVSPGGISGCVQTEQAFTHGV